MLREDGAKAIAGGQSLVPLMALRLARPTVLVDLSHVDGLEGVSLDADGQVLIGAMTTQRTLERSSILLRSHPLVTAVIPYIGHPAIRARGTIGGSLAHADPSAEWPALSLVLQAEFDIAGPDGVRRVAASDFAVGPFMTDLADDELLIAVRLPPCSATGVGVCEVARRRGDFALAGALAVVSSQAGVIRDARVAGFALGSTAVRLTELEGALTGLPVDRIDQAVTDTVPGGLDVAEDLHASRAFRSHLARVVVLRALRQALANEGELQAT